jgi:hypothetical protein
MSKQIDTAATACFSSGVKPRRACKYLQYSLAFVGFCGLLCVIATQTPAEGAS